MVEAASAASVQAQKNRAFWLKHLHQWHWVSAALCLIGMVLFSLTGFTLNHASLISARPVVTAAKDTVPVELLHELRQAAGSVAGAADGTSGPRAAIPGTTSGAIPGDIARWVNERFSVRLTGRQAEWSEDELYVSLPRPGGDAWLTIDLQDGSVIYELTDRGWIAYLNDLHKGRNTGTAWNLFIDVFAFAALVFAVTGLVLLKMHASRRPGTWPSVAFGLVLPMLLALLFIH